MPYYPKSQIQTNLHTNGGELIYKNSQKEYIGFYYKIPNGKIFTGKTPNNGASLELTPFNQFIKNNTIPTITPLTSESTQLITPVNDVSSRPNGTPYPTQINPQPYLNKIKPRLLPLPSLTLPTNNDYVRGVYTRYFCKKNNELKYMEIDKLTFDKLSSRVQDIAWDLYTPISTLWYLRNAEVNKNLVSLIEREQKWYGFTQWFKDNFFTT
jgi:hypothetical protein